MYRRFDLYQPRASQGSDYVPPSDGAIGRVVHEVDGEWEIEINRRRVGSTIRRDMYTVSIRAQSPRHDEFLSGFTSKQTALQTARQRVALLQAVRRRSSQRRAAGKV